MLSESDLTSAGSSDMDWKKADNNDNDEDENEEVAPLPPVQRNIFRDEQRMRQLEERGRQDIAGQTRKRQRSAEGQPQAVTTPVTKRTRGARPVDRSENDTPPRRRAYRITRPTSPLSGNPTTRQSGPVRSSVFSQGAVEDKVDKGSMSDSCSSGDEIADSDTDGI